jgi:4-hydroxybenzoate polyprenyltransferase
MQPAKETSLQTFIALLRAMRPKQWTKNVIVYAGIVFDAQLLVPESFLRVTATFILLCMISSSIYVLNDIVDVHSDRQHPRKRFRPIASGELPIPLARLAAFTLALVALGLSLLLSRWLTLILIIYMVLHITYAFRLKHIVIVDVMAIAAGYVLRVAAGAVVVQITNFSPWLYMSVALLALFLAIGKRRQELLLLAEKAGTIRVTFEHYNLPLLDEMLRMVMMGVLITYTLYTIETESPSLAGNNLALLTVPFVLYGIFRYLYLMYVEGEGSAPDEVLLKDRPLLLSILLWGVCFVAIIYLPRLF